MKQIIVNTGIAKYIPLEKSFFSSETELLKPHPGVMKILADAEGINMNRLLFVGNSFVDYQAAIAGGSIPVHLLHHQSKDDLALKQRIQNHKSLSDSNRNPYR